MGNVVLLWGEHDNIFLLVTAAHTTRGNVMPLRISSNISISGALYKQVVMAKIIHLAIQHKTTKA